METDAFYIHTYVIIFTLQNPELQLPALYPQNGLQWTTLSPAAVSLFKCIHTYTYNCVRLSMLSSLGFSLKILFLICETLC